MFVASKFLESSPATAKQPANGPMHGSDLCPIGEQGSMQQAKPADGSVSKSAHLGLLVNPSPVFSSNLKVLQSTLGMQPNWVGKTAFRALQVASQHHPLQHLAVRFPHASQN